MPMWSAAATPHPPSRLCRFGAAGPSHLAHLAPLTHLTHVAHLAPLSHPISSHPPQIGVAQSKYSYLYHRTRSKGWRRFRAEDVPHKRNAPHLRIHLEL